MLGETGFYRTSWYSSVFPYASRSGLNFYLTSPSRGIGALPPTACCTPFRCQRGKELHNSASPSSYALFFLRFLQPLLNPTRVPRRKQKQKE